MRWLLVLVVVFMSTIGQVSAEEVDVTVESNVNVRSRNTFEERQEIRMEVKAGKEDQLQERKSAAETIQEERNKKTQKKKEDRCEKMTARVEKRLASYEEGKNRWTSRYHGVRSRVGSLIGKLSEKGCNVDQLQTDMGTFDDLISEFAAEFRLFHDDLNASKAFACGENDGKFRSQLTSSRSSLKKAKRAGANLKNFVNNTLKPNLKASGEDCREHLSNS